MKIIKEGSLYFGTAVLERSVPFLLMPFLTRTLSTDEYGLISIFLTVVTILSLLVGFGVDGFVKVIFHKTGSDQFNKYVGTALFISIISLVFVVIIVTVFQDQLALNAGLPKILFPFVILVAAFRFVKKLRLAIYQTMRMPLNYAKLQIMQPVLDLFLVVILVYCLAGGGVERIYALVFASVISGIVALISLLRGGLIILDVNVSRVKRTLGFVLPLLPHSLALTAVFTVDKLILSSSLGLSFVGQLAVAVSLGSPTLIIAESINRAFMPWAYGKFRRNELYLVVGASYFLLACMLIVCLAYSGFLYLAFDLLVGDAFQNAFFPTLMLVWLGWIKLAYFMFAKGLQYSEFTLHRPILSLGAAAVYFILLLSNLQELSLIDIALYMLCFNIIVLIGTALISQWKFPQPWGNLDSICEVSKILFREIPKNRIFKGT